MTSELCIKQIRIFALAAVFVLVGLPLKNTGAKASDNIKNVNIYYSEGRNGSMAQNSSDKNSADEFSYYTDENNAMAYILHYIDSFETVNDGKNIQGGDLPAAAVRIAYMDDSMDTIRFFAERLVENGVQYGIINDGYNRFFDFAYALKTEKLILPQNVSFEPSEWAKEEVDRASSMGLIPEWNSIGYADDITRLEVCQLADNFLTMNGMVREIAKSQSFEDTRDPSVENLCSLGIIEGKTETEFYPYDYITREETAKILSGICKVSGIEPEGRSVEYADYDRISDWAAEYVDEMSAIGAFIGDDRNSFNPQNNITKEEFVVILLRLADKFI